jgi:hypothetical protein
MGGDTIVFGIFPKVSKVFHGFHGMPSRIAKKSRYFRAGAQPERQWTANGAAPT